eukprot:COSAG01_NODE_1641_length_9647_cov_5.299539_17_plen_37_part_00
MAHKPAAEALVGFLRHYPAKGEKGVPGVSILDAGPF